ncbi:MAG: hypothetical protein LBD54_02085 [Puniceicoccales bacterium]|jgi:hypothetical protein|nr:hypothetical protein [Puniceicoccales bacterium]
MDWQRYGRWALALLICPLGLGAERLGPQRRHRAVYDYQSRLPISPTLSEELVGILRQPKAWGWSSGRAGRDYWLFDAHGHPMIALDFSRFPLPREGLGAWLGRRVRLRGERVESPGHVSVLRVAFIRREEEASLSSVEDRPSSACKPPFPASLSGH